MSRPIMDFWPLVPPRVGYYGAYPFGFLEKARVLLCANRSEPVLHVCSGMARKYPYYGLGPNDKFLDLDANLQPDYVQDCRDPLPTDVDWRAIIADPPYTEEHAAHYAVGAGVFPKFNEVVDRMLEAVKPERKVGIIHFKLPRIPKGARLIAEVAVTMSVNTAIRVYTVLEKR